MDHSVSHSANISVSRQVDHPVNIFVSCQQTRSALAIVNMYHNAIIKSSCTPFNIRRNVWDNVHMTRYNCTIFGVELPKIIARIFDVPIVKQQVASLGRSNIKYEVSEYVQKQSACIADTVNYLAVTNTDAAIKLNAFITAYGNLDRTTINSWTDWENFVQQFVSVSWAENLHFKKVLQLFGATDKEVEMYLDTQNGYNCLSWLSKSLASYNIPGSISDIVNLIIAMTNTDDDKTEVMSDSVLVSLFYEKLSNGEVMSLWVPDVHVHDAENDDMLAVALTMAIRTLQKKQESLVVKVQFPSILPTNDEGKIIQVKEILESLGWDIFIDYDSINTDAIVDSFYKYSIKADSNI